MAPFARSAVDGGPEPHPASSTRCQVTVGRLGYGLSVPRAPMQVIVIPFRLREAHDPEYALFRRSDAKWQPIAGGAEDAETPAGAARREAAEEAGLPYSTPLYELQSLDSSP